MKPLKKLCTLRDSVFDVSKRDTVLNLTHLVDDKIKEKDFFEENFVTDGMKTLLVEAFRRLHGKSEQALFKLTQAIPAGSPLQVNLTELKGTDADANSLTVQIQNGVLVTSKP